MKISEIREKFPQYKDIPDEQLVIGLHRTYYKDMPFKEFHQQIQYDNAPDPTEGMSGVAKFRAGMGKAFTDIGRGAGQMIGMGPDAQEVQEMRGRDAALLNTGAGTAGNIAGNVAAFAPLAWVPGANTIAGAGVLGAASGALQPAASGMERLASAGGGAVLGGGVQALAGPVAKAIGGRATQAIDDLKVRQSQNAQLDETIMRGREAGYVVPPSAINEPSFIGGRLESLGGKAALGQEASLRNQPVTDSLARRAAGLRDDQAITADALRGARKDAALPYREISEISPQAAADLEMAQAARAESKLQWKHYNRSADPAAHKAATAADAQARAALDRIDDAAKAAGNPELIERLKLSRALIARNHQVQGALNRGTGNVEASAIGRSLDSGAPLTGELETIGRYQQAFPQFTREASKVPAPGVGKTELIMSAALAGGGAGLSDSPLGAVAGLAPFLAGPARGALLSRALQDSIAKPNYSAGMLTKNAAKLADPMTREKLALALRAGTIPMVPTVTRP
jgi:hypothetical protein